MSFFVGERERMRLSDTDVRYALDKAKELTEQYETYSRAKDHCQRSVDDLAWLCGDYLGKSVAIYDLKLAADEMVIRGMFAAMHDGSYEIYLLSELGDRERRFVKCKELFHVILDDEQCRSMDIYAHVQLAAAAFSIDDNSPESPVAWELLAEIAAMEFLLPYSERQRILAASGGNVDYADIARRYGVPQLYVENYLSDAMMGEFAKVMG